MANRRMLEFYIHREIEKNINAFNITKEILDELDYLREEVNRLKVQNSFLYQEMQRQKELRELGK